MPLLRCELCDRARKAGDESVRAQLYARLAEHLKRAHQELQVRTNVDLYNKMK